MRKLTCPLVSLSALLLFAGPALATPTTVPCSGGTCVATIQNPSNGVSYTLTTYDDGTNFVNVYQTSNDQGLDFANIYFDTTTGTADDNGSNLGFEITNDRAFIPGVMTGGPGNDGYYSLAGTGVTFTNDVDPTTGAVTITLTTPNSFFETDPTGIPFTTTLPGDEVTVHYSQAFGYDIVGGSNNYTLPDELGGAFLPAAVAATPEPSGLSYMVLTGLGSLSFLRKKLRRA